MTRRIEADEELVGFVTDAYPGLIRFGALLVGDRPGGEDVAQTALMKVYGSWGRDGQRGRGVGRLDAAL